MNSGKPDAKLNGGGLPLLSGVLLPALHALRGLDTFNTFAIPAIVFFFYLVTSSLRIWSVGRGHLRQQNVKRVTTGYPAWAVIWIVDLAALTLSLLKSKSTFSQPSKEKMHK